MRENDRNIRLRDLRLNGESVPGTVVSADISMSQGQHDQVVIRMVGEPFSIYGRGPSRLLTFTWGMAWNGRFYGYATDVTSERKSDKTSVATQITAMGPTFVMKQGRPRFFTEMTVGEVCAQLAAEHKLGFSDEYGKKHYVWRQLAQTDESDWEFLTKLAVKIGADLICSSGVIRLIDPMNVLTRQQPLAFFTAAKDDGQPTMYDMIPAHYSDRLPSQTSPTVSYLANGTVVTLDQNSPAVATAFNDPRPPPRNFSAERPLSNEREAAFAQIRMPVIWEEQATARLQGDPRIEPGTLLLLKSGRRTVVTLPYDGYWYVTSVVHQLTDMLFQSKVEVARVNKAPRLPPVTPKQWHMDPRGRPQLVLSATGNWSSTWR